MGSLQDVAQFHCVVKEVWIMSYAHVLVKGKQVPERLYRPAAFKLTSQRRHLYRDARTNDPAAWLTGVFEHAFVVPDVCQFEYV